MVIRNVNVVLDLARKDTEKGQLGNMKPCTLKKSLSLLLGPDKSLPTAIAGGIPMQSMEHLYRCSLDSIQYKNHKSNREPL